MRLLEAECQLGLARRLVATTLCRAARGARTSRGLGRLPGELTHIHSNLRWRRWQLSTLWAPGAAPAVPVGSACVSSDQQRGMFDCGASLRRPNEEQVKLGLGEFGVGDARVAGELGEFCGAQAVDVICGLERGCTG